MEICGDFTFVRLIVSNSIKPHSGDAVYDLDREPKTKFNDAKHRLQLSVSVLVSHSAWRQHDFCCKHHELRREQRHRPAHGLGAAEMRVYRVFW